ncbi:ER lumen protein retaining receptor protein, putative [Perkinsus marinus ATCC 50983]|uniref:ER lumen protein retaining receptor protein, putative n=2 Tax=Perkinsus marinus (strain ATCC 50983 / TXsc) TaxID=423536 RepID=C5K4N7_PERM5|nr:ER lumen protein retaining receptor protein, putative [Perkinsus marinus ATCC 50983]EER20309.1 ER lumen protein retaining receptor protein, putative [Perkinsus marinus ATCC 50983]|eukprot:XP_002788513.1 ER lumen protein retaining receptor protein, putative [Perkinsus marinus ATCC 50983]
MSTGIIATLQDPEKRKMWLANNMDNIRFWGIFCLVGLVLFYVSSDWDFSVLLTISSMISMFSFLMVVVKIETSKSVSGVSLKMFECYTLVSVCRLGSIIPFDGYLPYDRSGDWLYRLTEVISLCLASTVVYFCRVRYRATYEAGADTLKHVYLMIIALVLAGIFHPRLNAFMPADIAWAYALYLESVTVLPQLFMFQKQGKVEAFTSHFLAGQALSRVCSFIFWWSSYKELNDHRHPIKAYVGYWVMLMQLLQLIVMGDFIYHYINCLRKGVPVTHILSDVV